MRKALIAALIILILLTGCSTKRENRTVPTTPIKVSPMPYLKQAVVMRIDGRYRVVLFFEMPNPCHKVEFSGMEIEGNTITIDFNYTPPKPGMVCAQVLTKITKTVDLGELAKGSYTILIRINGSVVKVLRFSVY